ncbi:PASTA domain-containing protein [Panacibacter ginsenosidivorans]|uniref:PASTA domain-containing protein n=1 Tax=Panacibacter ginsenosidivorans TaxID=1813871 RepID=A0A5B8V5X0_9BACT|nr:PASTA domain-containing protein [Panacibacter ginsenosidivorans]QEC66877.1 PASTA domain-containing protein [Panacibacter ginsenosidivorans]
MFKFITHKSFLVNLLVIILLVGMLIFLFFSLLGVLTNHNETQKVPSVTGRTYDEAKKILEAAGFETGIQDSVYADTARPLQVMRQSPDVDASVKAGRTVYLTINRAVPPQVEMPDLRGFSIKSATLYLQSLGLKVGDTSYVYDIARNAVKEQSYNGKPITPGTKINMGSSISLVIGNGVSDIELDVPNLVGMTVNDARSLLSSYNIVMGAIIPLDAVSDTANAFVVNQKPIEFNTEADGTTTKNKIRPGQIMDIWISKQKLVTAPPEQAQ